MALPPQKDSAKQRKKKKKEKEHDVEKLQALLMRSCPRSFRPSFSPEMPVCSSFPLISLAPGATGGFRNDSALLRVFGDGWRVI